MAPSTNGKLALDDTTVNLGEMHPVKRRGFVLCESLRTSMLKSETKGMPSVDAEMTFRRMAESGEWDPSLSPGHELIWEILDQDVWERRPFTYLFELARRHLGESTDGDGPTLEAEDWEFHAVELFRVQVLSLALINPGSSSEWFHKDLIEEMYVYARSKVKHPKGSHIFHYAVSLARRYPISLSMNAFNTRIERERLELCASIAYRLHVLCGGGAIKIPTELLGQVWGLEDESARNCGSALLKVLENGGLLKRTKAHVAGRLAAEFKFQANMNHLYRVPT